jgi:hypothetical protein
VTATLATFLALMEAHGSDVTYHRESGGTPCPCRTREGNRDPKWHKDHPLAPVCNELGMLPVITAFTFKGAVQPVSAGGMRRSRTSELVERLFPAGEIRTDDHIGIFPTVWNSNQLDFDLFTDTGESYLIYDGRRFIVVAADKLPDIDGDPDHHWECGLRLVSPVRVTD